MRRNIAIFALLITIAVGINYLLRDFTWHDTKPCTDITHYEDGSIYNACADLGYDPDTGEWRTPRR